jgi:hypothetical protein
MKKKPFQRFPGLRPATVERYELSWGEEKPLKRFPGPSRSLYTQLKLGVNEKVSTKAKNEHE